MSEREQYIEMRRTGQYNLEWFYRYYCQKSEGRNRSPIPFGGFHQAFQMYFQMNPHSIFETADIDMKVQKIEGPQGELLYIN